MTRVVPVFLCGGIGKRLWPLSTEVMPKQFLPLLSDGLSPLQGIVKYFRDNIGIDGGVFITNVRYRDLLLGQLYEVGAGYDFIILEEDERNTAFALSVANKCINMHFSEETIVLVTPTDNHWGVGCSGYIDNSSELRNAVIKSIPYAKMGHIMTLGIKPTRPSEQYGYIELGSERLDDSYFAESNFEIDNDHEDFNDDKFYQVNCLREKPDTATVRDWYIKSNFVWNSGIYIGKSSIFDLKIKDFANNIYYMAEFACYKAKMDKKVHRKKDGIILKLSDDLPFFLKKLEKNQWLSIEKAFIEKMDDLYCYRMNNCDWYDLGSWEGIREFISQRQQGEIESNISAWKENFGIKDHNLVFD